MPPYCTSAAADVRPEFAQAQTFVAGAYACMHDKGAEIYAWEATPDLKRHIRTFSSTNCYFCQLKPHGSLCECVFKGSALNDYEKVSIRSELGGIIGILLRTSANGHFQGCGTGQAETRSNSGNSQRTT
jgi:hypothetical protein